MDSAFNDRELMYSELLAKLNNYLERGYVEGEIIEGIYRKAKQNIGPNLRKWLFDEEIKGRAVNFIEGLALAVTEAREDETRWDHICEAFYSDIAFGTGGIRGLAAFTVGEFQRFADRGIYAPILKGPNTINDIVLLLKTAGVARWAADRNLTKVVIGYDSRMNGKAFAELIAKTFLGAGLIVYLFDEPCPYPELTFAIPTVEADFGILVSASHNDKRYNGYKLSSKTGAQFDPVMRNEIYENYIVKADLRDITLVELGNAQEGQLVFLGGNERLYGVEYYNCALIDIHSMHIAHVKKFMKMNVDWLIQYAKKLKVGYTAYFGAGYRAVPRLLEELHFGRPIETKEMNRINGAFPLFDLYQQPDPGDPIAAEIAVHELKKELDDSEIAFGDLDIVIGTDPDADRTGLIVKVPKDQEDFVREVASTPIRQQLKNLPVREDFSWALLDADNAWAILLWFRLMMDRENGIDNSSNFIVLSHTTSDALAAIARKFGLGVVKTWVGFAMISNVVQRVWDGEKISPKHTDTLRDPMVFEVLDMDHRSINVGGFEQSNGFSILGSKPGLGEVFHGDGHVRDKDGTFAAILLAELAAYAKQHDTTIWELVDEKIYLDPEIGFFYTYYEPSPYWGQFEGLSGLSKKIKILDNVRTLHENFRQKGSLRIAGFDVVDTEFYGTGKYDELHGYKKGSGEFPDEGIRFFFDDSRQNHLTVRPSGTSQCLRYHVQLKDRDVTRANLVIKKMELCRAVRKIVEDVRNQVESSVGA